MYAVTENYAGGNRIKHRTIEAAARRIAYGGEVYLGYHLTDYDSDETREAVEERVKELTDVEV